MHLVLHRYSWSCILIVDRSDQNHVRKERDDARIHSFLLIAFFATLTSAGGFIRIPTPIVPVTLQTLFVYLAGDLLGRKKGAMSQGLFLMIGLIGVPVFSMGGGLGYVLQPTFGYLLSFPLAAWIVGTVRGWNRIRGEQLRLIAANTAGFLTVSVIGVVFLYLNLNFVVHSEIGWKQAVWSGALLFLPSEAVKVLLAGWLSSRLEPIVHRFSA